MSEFEYKGKALKDYTLWELGDILTSLNAAETRRQEASTNPKFEKMEFPPINPNFVKLKNQVELEIGNKQNAST